MGGVYRKGGWEASGKRPNSDILIDNFQKMGYKLQELLGELNRLRIPVTDNQGRPLEPVG
jgi:hypothetical protein